MTGYLVNFTVYTMAMLGLIFFALMVYKKFAAGSSFSKISKNKTLSIEETISIAPRKTLYVVKAGEERFLIAGDVDKTTLISKLGAEGTPVKNFNDEVSNNCLDQHVSKQKTKPLVETSSKVVNFTKNKPSKKIMPKSNSSVDDLPIIVDFHTGGKSQPSVIKDMLKKMNG